MCVCELCVGSALGRPGEGIRSPGTEITNVCETTCEYWEPNLSLLEEQLVLLMARIHSVITVNSFCFHLQTSEARCL